MTIRKWFRKMMWEMRRRKFCKLNGYNCPECIYHNWVFDGCIFRGNDCLYPKGEWR